MAPQTLRSRWRKRAAFTPPRASRRRSLSPMEPAISTPGKAAGKSSRSKRSRTGPRLPTLLGSYPRAAVPGSGAEQYRGAEDMPVGGLNENRDALAGSGRLKRECRLAAAPLAERREAFGAVCVIERAARIFAGADLRPALLRKADEPDLAAAVTGGGRSGADRHCIPVRGEGHQRDRRGDRLPQCREHRLALRADHLARAVDHKLRRVDRGAEEACIAAWALGRLRCRERVLPAELVPVIDVEAERDDIAAPRQLAEQSIGRRAGGAALRGEQFDDGRAISGSGRHRND